MGSWEIALDTMMEGNERFVTGETYARGWSIASRRKELLEQGQKPIAVVVCEADAYMPPELVFDSDFGELFTIRLPELSIDKNVLDAITYAAEKLHTPLCVVLAHDERRGDPLEGGEGLAAWFKGAQREPDELLQGSLSKIRKSPELSELIDRGEFIAVGARYDLATGEVTVYDF